MFDTVCIQYGTVTVSYLELRRGIGFINLRQGLTLKLGAMKAAKKPLVLKGHWDNQNGGQNSPHILANNRVEASGLR